MRSRGVIGFAILTDYHRRQLSQMLRLCTCLVSIVKASPYSVDRMTTYDDLLYRLKQMEELLRFLAVGDNLANAHTMALSIARDAPTPGIADLGSKVIAAVNGMKRNKEAGRGGDVGLQKALWRLRLALQEGKRDQGN